MGSRGDSEALIISINMSCVSFWKIIASPESTRFDYATSVRKALRALALKLVLVRKRPSRCC